MRVFFQILILALTFVSNFSGPGATQDAPAWGLVNVGVLAHRGTGDFETTWAPLRDYLDQEILGWRFQFTPVTLTSAQGQLENHNVDFLITNPGHYIALERDFPMSVLATRVRLSASGEATRAFGSTIFTVAGSEIEALRDIKGGSVLAVDADAFGGFQVAWHEFANQGIDLFRDPASLAFSGFPQDQIVERVLDGSADVGIVRSGLLETMAREGRVDLADVTVLYPNANYNHPDQLSTRLYPEWPFLAMGGTDTTLRNAVARALLGTPVVNYSAHPQLPDSWEAPVSYHAVRELLVAYDYARRSKVPVGVKWIVLTSLGALVLGAAVFLLRRRRTLAEHQLGTAPVPEPAPATQVDQPLLTRREAEILGHICNGHSSKEIAEVLGISPKTVEFHRSNLFRKFDVGSSLQLVNSATEYGT